MAAAMVMNKTRHDRPAKNTTNKPEAIIKVAVPKSGCFKIKATGTMMMAMAPK